MAKAKITEETIRDIAHKIWIEEGQPEGHADRHWFAAIEQIANTNLKPARKKAPAKAVSKADAKAPAKAEAKPAAKKTTGKKAA